MANDAPHPDRLSSLKTNPTANRRPRFSHARIVPTELKDYISMTYIQATMQKIKKL